MSTVETTRTARAPLPGVLSLGLARGGIELRRFFREKESMIFTLSFPAIMLLLLGSVFGKQFEGTGVTGSQVYVAGMIGAGVMSAAFMNLGNGIALDREDGTLKRLRGTPMPPAAYFLGKVVLVLVTSICEVVLLLAVGVAVFDLPLPSSADRWLTFGWVFVLGVVASTLLGIAISSLARSASAAAGVITLPFMVLQFISGVFIPVNVLPSFLVDVSSFLPLKWMCQGFRSVFLPDALAAQEAAGAWQLDRVALVLGVWCVAGLVLCLTTFRWKSRRDG